MTVRYRAATYARCSRLFDYWTISDVTINGQRFVIEQHGELRDWADAIIYGTEYYLDGQEVGRVVFDQALRLAELGQQGRIS